MIEKMPGMQEVEVAEGADEVFKEFMEMSKGIKNMKGNKNTERRVLGPPFLNPKD